MSSKKRAALIGAITIGAITIGAITIGRWLNAHREASKLEIASVLVMKFLPVTTRPRAVHVLGQRWPGSCPRSWST